LTLLAAATAVAGKAAAAAPTAKATLSPQQQASLRQALESAQVQPQAPMPMTWFQQHVGWLTHGIAGVFIIAAIALVVLLAVQTTKQEGLSGTIGGRVESAYSRMGAEDQLKRITGIAAFLFVLSGFILSLTGI
jgi:preprotein translocase subunit SecG